MTAVVVYGYDFKVVSKCNGDVKAMQKAVGDGPFALLVQGENCKYEAYVNEEALCTPGHSINAIGYAVAMKLGFRVDMMSMAPYELFGPILFTAKKKKGSLTEGDIAEIRALFDAETKDEEDEPESDPPKEKKKADKKKRRVEK